MKKDVIVGGLLLCFAIGLISTKLISGGKEVEKKVEAVVKTNTFLNDLYGGDITKIERSAGPWRVKLGLDGLRQGSFSYIVEGTKTNGHYKIDWKQLTNREIEIVRISLRSPFQENRILWVKQ
jgi:hypothetical protein